MEVDCFYSFRILNGCFEKGGTVVADANLSGGKNEAGVI